VSSTLTGRATFVGNPNALLIAEDDADSDFGVSANIAVQRITQATLDHGVPWHPPLPSISEELIALVGKVVKVEALGVGEIENDFGTGCSPRGSQSAKFARFEGKRDLLRFR
jgi:hypothetical protein